MIGAIGEARRAGGTKPVDKPAAPATTKLQAGGAHAAVVHEP
jgi:hypothetical protein